MCCWGFFLFWDNYKKLNLYIFLLYMQIFNDFDMKDYITFSASAKVKKFVVIESENDLKVFLKNYSDYERYYFLWWWANTLFIEDFDGTVVHIAIKWKTILEEHDESILISVFAWDDWIDFVDWTVDSGYLWLENLVQIPGSVGASPVQNIGAYWSEVKDTIVSVAGFYVGNSEEKVILSSKECKFSYRDSIFKNELKWKFIITNVIFRLEKNILKYPFKINYAWIQQMLEQKNIVDKNISQKNVSDIIKELRKSKLPDRKKIWTAGSFFKNPIVKKSLFDDLLKKYDNLIFYSVMDDDSVKLSAGQLIDMTGLKWFREWDVWIYEKHALVLVNYGDASGKDIWNFANMIHCKVKDIFGVNLETEVNLVK